VATINDDITYPMRSGCWERRQSSQ